jgi:uncharacterized protein HemX
MNQNIPVQPPQYETHYPPQQSAPPVKTKSKKGLKIILLSVVLIIVIAGLFLYKQQNSDLRERVFPLSRKFFNS